MPHPREAIFDVLKSKAERAAQESKLVQGASSLKDAYEDWNADNQRARSSAALLNRGRADKKP